MIRYVKGERKQHVEKGDLIVCRSCKQPRRARAKYQHECTTCRRQFMRDYMRDYRRLACRCGTRARA